jgi:transposase
MASSPFEGHPRKCTEALHILDRFHIVAKMNKALDEVRADETRRMRLQGLDPILRKSRWLLLRREENLKDEQRFRLRDILRYNLKIEPMKKIARSLREHRELILNYFRAKKTISSGTVEGLNNKAKVTMRKSYGFRTFRVLELSLYHALGKLPEPESTHDFF